MPPVRFGAIGPALALLASSARPQSPIGLVSADAAGHPGNGASAASHRPALSADGRYVAFESDADQLVPGDNNRATDVFVRDLATGAIVRVSVDSSGVEGDDWSGAPALSADGRFVAFTSKASNLIANDATSAPDVYLRDRDPDGNGIFDEGNGITILVSAAADGTQGNQGADQASLSSDGSIVAFSSDSTNLVAGDSNGAYDIFVRDFAAGTIEIASVSSSGVQCDYGAFAPSLSGDGSLVAFESPARNLVDGDTNRATDVFVRDRANGTTTRVSVDSNGAQVTNPSWGAAFSADGTLVCFTSLASNLVKPDGNQAADVFAHDLATGATTRISVDSNGHGTDGESSSPAVSSDGRYVAFRSVADDVVAGDSNGRADVFVRDRVSGITAVASAACGAFSDGDSVEPALCADGSVVAFASDADDLVFGDGNGVRDVFVRAGSDPDAAWSNYGSGFPGTFGVPGLALDADPVLGTTVDLVADNSRGDWTAGFLLIGLARASIPTSLGGTLLVDFFLLQPYVLRPEGLTLTLDLPGLPAYAGLVIDAQILEVDPGAGHGFSFSPGLEFELGE